MKMRKLLQMWIDTFDEMFDVLEFKILRRKIFKFKYHQLLNDKSRMTAVEMFSNHISLHIISVSYCGLLNLDCIKYYIVSFNTFLWTFFSFCFVEANILIDYLLHY
jgi:hypothetical protein